MSPLPTIIATVALCAWSPATACLWDSDTISQEATGKLEVIETAVGWFDRFPPLYYQMRLDRVSAEIENTPQKLELYDDAAVACDRLGKQDDAIVWMDRKQAQMKSIPEATLATHRYRHLANLGTFHAHRWIKTPKRNQDQTDLDQAIKLIKEAITTNPEAHFGREVAQLAILEWLKESLRPHKTLEDSASLTRSIDEGVIMFGEEHTQVDLSKALCGLVQMGAAWDSIDVFIWLAKSEQIQFGSYSRSPNTSLAELILWRITELAAKGGTTISGHGMIKEIRFGPNPSATSKPQPVAIKEADLWNDYRALKRYMIRSALRTGSAEIANFFKSARSAADRRHEARTQFIMNRLQSGQHPDTDAAFWNGWIEPTIPKLPAIGPWERILGPTVAGHLNEKTRFILFLATNGVFGLLLFWILRRLQRMRRNTRRTND